MGRLCLTVGERKIGAFSRNFSSPCDVDNVALRATLKDGLVRMVVPRCESEAGFEGKARIE